MFASGQGQEQDGGNKPTNTEALVGRGLGPAGRHRENNSWAVTIGIESVAYRQAILHDTFGPLWGSPVPQRLVIVVLLQDAAHVFLAIFAVKHGPGFGGRPNMVPVGWGSVDLSTPGRERERESRLRH